MSVLTTGATKGYIGLHSLKMKYQKQNSLLGQTGAGHIYEDLLSSEKTKNIVDVIQKEFLWWGDLHGWWHMNPAYNNMWSAADSSQNFSVHAVELSKLQSTPFTGDLESHPIASTSSAPMHLILKMVR
ncbi:hypothetical protein F5141DRAFT_1065871 [Pisolithus sp. B1]|nr:hypothetical protein F5141DRAFT_1065871 [Pisolithus sp. B1]